MKLKKTMLIKLSLLGFLFAFLLIYFIEDNIEINLISVSQLDNSYLNKYVKISGEVISVRNSETSTFIVIEDRNFKINGILFDSVKIDNGEYIFEGKVTKYNDELEIIIEKYY